MNHGDIIAIIAIMAGFLPCLFCAVFAGVKLAIRSEVQKLELRVGKEYVRTKTCEAIRADRDRIRCAGK